MHRRPFAARAFAATLFAFALIASSGCGRGSAAHAAREREWTAMEDLSRQLGEERRTLADLRAQLAKAPVSAENAPLAAEDQELAARAEALARAVSSRSSGLEARIVAFVGDEAPSDGEAAPVEIRKAIRLKSDEDIEVASEWIEQGGDYRRAIEIYETQLEHDPDYPRLVQALERARAARFASAAAVAGVKPGMTPSEVRALLGPVNLRQVLHRPAERLLAWYYPQADGGRVGVFFRYDGDRHAFLVYETQREATVEAPKPGLTGGRA
jgi:hypothetical protein